VTFSVISEVLLNGDRQLRQRVQLVLGRYLNLVESLLEEGVKKGEVDPAINRNTAAVAFFGLIQATITLWRIVGDEMPVAARSEALWQLFRNGVAVR
jgi:TetR/AcrR family fatty acid metabolism transcriptional regulator